MTQEQDDSWRVPNTSLGSRCLLAVLVVSLLWRVPSLFDPPWVNDEGTYFAVAQAMSHGYRLYAGIWENKPPALYLVYDAVYHLTGPSLLAVRLLAAAATLGIVVLVTLIAARYAGGVAPLASGMLAGLLLGVPFLEGTTANAEIFLSFGMALAVYLAVIRDRPGPAGVSAGISVLFKVVGGFDALAIAVWLWCERPRCLAKYLAGGLAVFSLTVLVAWHARILTPMVRDAVLYNLGYVGHANGGSIPWLLVLKLGLLGAATLWLRHRPFPFLWLAYAALGSLFSGRIFGHYFIEVIAPASVCAGWWFDRHRWVTRRSLFHLPAAFLALALASSIVGFALQSTGNRGIFTSRLEYYANFVRYALGTEAYPQYRSQIDDHVNRNIRIAATLRTLPAGRVLIWGNIPWVYVLSDRLPATPYTSALRDPRVPGETGTLRHAVAGDHPIVVVVRPPAPPLGSAQGALRRDYRVAGRIDNAVVYVSRALSPRVAK